MFDEFTISSVVSHSYDMANLFTLKNNSQSVELLLGNCLCKHCSDLDTSFHFHFSLGADYGYESSYNGSLTIGQNGGNNVSKGEQFFTNQRCRTTMDLTNLLFFFFFLAYLVEMGGSAGVWGFFSFAFFGGHDLRISVVFQRTYLSKINSGLFLFSDMNLFVSCVPRLMALLLWTWLCGRRLLGGR
jgi:hypothetical protein